MRVHWKRVPQNRSVLNAQLVKSLPDYRGRWLSVRKPPDGKSVTHGRYARNLPLPQEIFAGKRDPAVSTTLITRRFSTKNKLRNAVEMSRQPGQLCIWTVAWLVLVAAVAIWVEQGRMSRRQFGSEAWPVCYWASIPPEMAFLFGLSETGVKFIVPHTKIQPIPSSNCSRLTPLL